MLITRSLSFAYNQKAKFNFPDIDLDQAEDLLVLGESGIGKTTLLHLMAGLLTPSDGFVELSGTQLKLANPPPDQGQYPEN
ncbi:MAG: ATP-binding cassette domain-containing protein [Bacteroidota bacterium]